MDAYDIFKKLTKGLTFKHRVLGVKNNGKPSKLLPLKKEEIKIKDEPDSDQEDTKNEINSDNQSDPGHESGSENETGSENDSKSENEDNSDTEMKSEGGEDDLQLLQGVKIGEKRKKKKKKEKTEDLKKKLELEEQNHFRNEYGIKAVGRHIPPALRDFSELVSQYNVSQSLVNTVYECGYTEPTPVQRQALPCMLEDRQIVACAPTGSGKTAAFLIPLFHCLGAPAGGPRALVLCPTRELAMQTHREALRLGAAAELRCSIVRSVKQSKVKEREATFRKSDIVISTPNRLCYLLNQDNVNISLDKIRWLIIDEADKLFEGSADQENDFRQQLEQIMSACGSKQRRVAMFSATHTPAVAKWSRRNLRGLINITVGQRNAAAETVDQELLYCGNENGKLIAFRQLVQQGLKPPVLVFVQSKDRAKQLFKELIYDGINVDVIHADRTQTQRDNVVRSFRVGRIWVLICTELMGRGIDFRGVNLVINYDFPTSAISYVHRVGRAGRAGQRGRAITFFTQDDIANLRSIASVMKQSGCEVPEYMLKLKQNSNKRKRLLKKAPHRDKISTILEKPSKRKMEDAKENKETQDKSQNITEIKDAKSKKHRKLQPNGFQQNSVKINNNNKNKDKNKNKNTATHKNSKKKNLNKFNKIKKVVVHKKKNVKPPKA